MQNADVPLKEIRVIDGFLKWTDEDLSIVQDMCLHGINNSLDHGFILPRQRGESLPSPVIEVLAQSEPGFLLIQIRDNGVGLDLDRLEKLAAKHGFVPGTGATASDILFEDGVSTAREVSLTSGRGVGVAAVKSRVLARGGATHIQNNEAGPGTLLWARLPVGC